MARSVWLGSPTPRGEKLNRAGLGRGRGGDALGLRARQPAAASRPEFLHRLSSHGLGVPGLAPGLPPQREKARSVLLRFSLNAASAVSGRR